MPQIKATRKRWQKIFLDLKERYHCSFLQKQHPWSRRRQNQTTMDWGTCMFQGRRCHKMTDSRTQAANCQERKGNISKHMVRNAFFKMGENNVDWRGNWREAEYKRKNGWLAMMTNNANVLYPGVRLNALHAILYFISKVSSIVPILHMRKLNSKKLGYLIKSHAGRTRIQTQIFMTSKQTIPHCLIQKILFKPPLKLWLTTYWGYRDEELLGHNRSGCGTYTGWSLPSKREEGETDMYRYLK